MTKAVGWDTEIDWDAIMAECPDVTVKREAEKKKDCIGPKCKTGECSHDQLLCQSPRCGNGRCYMMSTRDGRCWSCQQREAKLLRAPDQHASWMRSSSISSSTSASSRSVVISSNSRSVGFTISLVDMPH